MDEIIIFTDGASKGNPGPGGWGSIILFPKGKKDNNFQFSIFNFQVVELGGREKHTTNNQMELMAAIEVLKYIGSSQIPTSYPLILYTDSSYLINGITKWVHGWQKNNWVTKSKKEVLNRSLWKKLIEASRGKKIKWEYVGGHRGIKGNERCDEIATSFANGKKVTLYKGQLAGYKLDILDISFDDKKSKQRTKDRSRSKITAYSYLSLVNGKIQKHSTWADCEKRVKGKSGAKFKKTISAEDEKEIIKEWKK